VIPSNDDLSSRDGGRHLFDGGGRNILFPIFSSLRINIALNYLMNTLSGKIKFIRNLAERQSRSTHFKNFRISSNISSWPWLKRTPLPPWDNRDSFYSIRRKFIFLISLPRITNPGSKINFCSFDYFNMNSRNSTVALSRRELPKSICIHLKACFVVHIWDSNSVFSNLLKLLIFKKRPQYHLTPVGI